MTSQLILRTPCEHGHRFAMDYNEKWNAWVPCSAPHLGIECKNPTHCPGGSETALDPTTIVQRGFEIGTEYVGTTLPGITVADILAALTDR